MPENKPVCHGCYREISLNQTAEGLELNMRKGRDGVSPIKSEDDLPIECLNKIPGLCIAKSFFYALKLAKQQEVIRS